MDESLAPLVPLDVYEQHAVHIGTNQKSADMRKFLDTMRQDGGGLHLIDVHQTDSRIRTVAKFLSNYDPERILVVAPDSMVNAPLACSHRASAPCV